MTQDNKDSKEFSKKNIKIIPAKAPETGIDTDKTIISNILEAADVGQLDLASLNSLIQSAQTREQSYELIDTMAQDDVISAVLETYAEDTVQTNDKGQTVWVEAHDSKILEYVNWLLESLNTDKHLYQWAYCLVTYGDVYIRLFKKSDVKEGLLFGNKDKKGETLNESAELFDNKKPEDLKEGVKLKVHLPSDKYITYVQMVDNPGEMFDLQKFGKTYGYIKAPIRTVQAAYDNLYNYMAHYKMRQSDVEIFDGTSFVHGCLENTNQRQPETVDIYLDSSKDFNEDDSDSMTDSYSVKRGQSILYNAFKIWRETNLLEMSAMLNRLTKSSIVRILTVDVGDMPKEQVQVFMSRLKEKIEQKSAIDTAEGSAGMREYTAAGPIENTIYVPVHGTQGNITTTTVGGDFDPKSLIDLEYFRDKLFGALKVPKQYFGQTGDDTGFNGGSSLTIISSRYGKTIKRLQNILCQMVADIVNLFLIDRGMSNYVNKFRIRMQTPVTQEEIDKRTNIDNRLRFVDTLMAQLTDIDDKVTKLKIYKALVADIVNNSDVVAYIDDYIKKLEAPPVEEGNDADISENAEGNESIPIVSEAVEGDKELLIETRNDEQEEEPYLPSPAELGLSLLELDDMGDE